MLSVLASHAELLIALEPVLAALESHASTTLHSHQQHLLHLTTTTACRLAAHKDRALPPALLRDEGVGVLGGVERMEGVGSVVELADAWGGGADTATASNTDVNRALQVMQEALAPMLGSKPLPTPAARIHLADALLALILLSDSDLFTTPLLALLHDRDYGVRLHMAHLLPALFLKWEDHPALLTDTLPAVCRSLPLLAGPAGKGALLGLMRSGGGGGGRDEGKGGSGGEGGEEGGAGGSGETDEERVRREVERVDRARVETGVLLLGRIAESSDLVEDEVIFLIAAAAALRLVRTNLAAAVLTTAAASLGYPSLSQYLDILLPSVATRWVAADPVLLPLPALAQVVVALEQAGGGRGMGGAGCWTAGGGGRQMLEEKGDHEAGGDTAWVVAAGVGGAGALARAWKRLAPLVLPALLLLGRKSDVQMQFLAEALQAPVPRLLKESFPHVVAALLPFGQSELDTWQKEAATRVLTTGLLATAGWSEAERDQLLTKHMVPIITSLLQHTSSQQHPSLPSFPTACIRATICTLVDSTADSHASSNSNIPRVSPISSLSLYQLLLALHKAAVAACSPRHRCHIIAALSVLVDILGNRVTVPPTFRYLVHILLACLPTSAPTWPPPAPPLASSQLSLSQSPSCPLPSPSTPAAVAAVCLDVLARVVAAAQSNGAREGGHSGMASAAVLDQSQIPPSPATLSAPPLPLSLQAIVSRLLALCTPPAAEAAVGAAAAGAGGGAIGVAEGGAAAGAAGQEGELPEALVELLRAFTVDAPAAVRARLQLFHMPAAAVAAYPSLAPIADSLSSLSHDLPLPQQLAQLASRAISLSPAVLAQSLEALCNHLASTKHLLWCDETAPAAKGVEGAAGSSSRELDAGGPGDGLPRPSAEALTATWQMLQVSRRLSESDPCTSTIRACLGRLLAALGIWDASAVSFKPPATATSTAAPTAASAPTGGVTVVNADPAGEGVHEGVIVSVLKLLATLLVDPDVHAIQLAAQTIEVRPVLALLLPSSCLLKLLSQDPSLFPVASALRLHRVTAILMTERGHRVFTATGFEEKQYLEAHIKTVNTAHAQQIIQRLRADAGASMPPLDDPAVWQAVGASHEAWVCRVVHLLILHAPDDILTLCAPLCRVNASLAALLLPHTLATLAASHAPTSLLCRTISTQLTTHVLQPARAVSPRTLQLLLDALTALRACHTRARIAPPPTAAAAARAAASAMGARKSAAKATSAAAPSTTTEASTRTAAGVAGSSSKGKRGGRRGTKKSAAESAAGGQEGPAVGAEAEEAGAAQLRAEEKGAEVDEDEPEAPQHWQSPVWLQLDLLTLAQAAQHCGGAPRGAADGVLQCRERARCHLRCRPHQQASVPSGHRPPRGAMGEGSRDAGPCHVPPPCTCWCCSFLWCYSCSALVTYEAAWKMGKWDLPAAQLPDSSNSSPYPPSTLPILTAPPGSSSTTASTMPGAASGFHAALYSALKALHDDDCTSAAAAAVAAQQTIVCQLASMSAESALHINSRLVLLQALENVREAAAPTLARGGGPPIHAGQARHTELHTWQRQLAACGSSFELQEPLLSCRGAYLRASGQHNALPLHLLEAASLCRKARLLSQAAVHVQHLKDACRTLTARSHTPTTVPHLPPTSSAATASAEEGTWGVEGVAFCGRVEEAKLLALEGQQDMAVRLLQHLLRPDLPPHASQGSASASAASAAVTTAAVTTVAAACVPVSDRVYTLGLAAKWLGETRSISSRVVLNDYLWRAVDLTTHPPTASHSASPSAAAAAATAPPSYASLPFANNWHQQKQERQWKQQQQQQQGGFGGQQGGEREQGGQGGEQGQWQQRRQWGEVHFQMARYVDGLFVVLHTRLHSQQWRAAQDLTNHKRKELEEMTKRLKASRREDERRVYGMKMMELQKQLSMDDQEANDLQGEHDMYLRAALENYRNCLLAADTFNIKGVTVEVVFRLTALWFTLLNDATADAVNAEMLTTIQTVPSYKFLPLVYQMASRMSERDPHGSPPLHPETPDFQSVLTTLVKRMADDHPLHTVPVLMALANGNRVRSSQRGRNLFVVDEDKIRAAKAVLGGMAERHKPMLDEMQQLMDLYIRLAEMESSKEDLMRSKQLPRNFRSVRDLLRVPVLTASVPVDRTCCYAPGSFPAFCGLKDSMRVMHGVNAPKVVECVGSDGRVYKQLAKSGNDDLRQDAVMEQLFGLVNSLLQAHEGATRRHLAIRTYKVVPFTPSAGLLEWVDGTLPLGEYLLGSTRKGGAHARYGGSDWPFMTCREVMARESDKRQAFDKVLQNFHPVMRHFFLERFLLPANWFDRRLTYTRSVAATSMVGYVEGLGDWHAMNILQHLTPVGYVVGLGDRHAMNILVDERSAEVVHIDLGIAFEQGLMLKTPEKVPFRLTRDIIDGMGVSGVEGVFRRCCETVLAVMRENKEALLTIIEVSGVSAAVTIASAPMLVSAAVTIASAPMLVSAAVTIASAPMLVSAAVTIASAPMLVSAAVTIASAPMLVSAAVTIASAPMLVSAAVTIASAPMLVSAAVTIASAPMLVSAAVTIASAPMLVSAAVTIASAPMLVSAAVTIASAPMLVSAAATIASAPMLDSAAVTIASAPMLDSAAVTIASAPMLDSAAVTIASAPTLDSAAVFIYDPLYKWALSPLKALHRQKMEESEEAMEEEGTEEESGAAMEGNEEATRALLRVKQKLDGFEDGEMRSLAGQVQQLIKDAQDPDRLAVMFPGWGAWL
ncbi:unnamed protein product [Closterium sp. NIES-64]|nr:unnamed protein product [Closterium sp. NIES-64]